MLLDYFFNAFTTAGLISFIFLILLYGFWKESGLNNYILYWAITVILHLVFFLLNLNEVGPGIPILQQLGYPLSLLHMPLFYLGINASMGINNRRKMEAIIHLIPYTLFVLALIGLSVSGEAPITVKNGFLVFGDRNWAWFRKHNGNILAASGAIYTLLILRRLFQCRQLLLQTQSTVEDYQLKWIRFLIYSGILLFVVIYLLIISGSEAALIPRQAVFKYVSIYLGVFGLLFSYRFQSHLFRLFKTVSSSQALLKERGSLRPKRNTQTLETIAEKISHQLVKEQLFLDENLSLHKLAESIGVSPHTTSEAINHIMKTNFYHLINSARIEYARKLLKNENYHHFSILGIAQECGFSSKSTFYKLFREHTGTTPTKYRNLKK